MLQAVHRLYKDTGFPRHQVSSEHPAIKHRHNGAGVRSPRESFAIRLTFLLTRGLLLVEKLLPCWPDRRCRASSHSLSYQKQKIAWASFAIFRLLLDRTFKPCAIFAPSAATCMTRKQAIQRAELNRGRLLRPFLKIGFVPSVVQPKVTLNLYTGKTRSATGLASW